MYFKEAIGTFLLSRAELLVFLIAMAIAFVSAIDFFLYSKLLG
jgi:hypothetical protein